MALNISNESAPFCKMATRLNKKFSEATAIRRRMGAGALPRIKRFFSAQNGQEPNTLQMRQKSHAPRVSDHRAFFGNYPVYKKKNLLISREQRATIRMLEESNLDTTGANRP
jgi:hypothetical protein